VAGDTVPQVAPLQPVPITVQFTPLFAESLATVAVNACVPFTATLAVDSDNVTATCDAAADTVIVAAAVLVVSATDVAFRVTAAGVGTAAGAVYVTAAPEALVAGDTVPHVAPLQPAPLALQVTPLFAESPVTVAVKACVPPTVTLAVDSESVTATGAGVVDNVMVVAADFVPSATEVAVKVTAAGFGTVAGAV
jgi:hypothetical protein